MLKPPQRTFILHKISNVYHYWEWVMMFGWTKQAAVFSGVTLCDGMRYNSAKNMTYIPNEGVDMYGDADPGAFSSSNCNTMDIIIT